MNWTCKCGEIALDVPEDEITIGYASPIAEEDRTYVWHSEKECVEHEVGPLRVAD